MKENSHGVRGSNILLTFLVAAYTFNFIDRTIIAVIGEAIKRDLRISDAQLGLLGGAFFALFYTFLGLPIARIAERVSRVNVIAASIAIWSVFTALCGLASSFLMLALFRIGVGVGEAGLTPPGHSLIADYFPASRRASALAIYGLGIPLGTMLGALAGGWITQAMSWRSAFLLVGLPGLVLALLFKLCVREPDRNRIGRTMDLAPWSVGSELRDVGAVFVQAARNPALRHMIIGSFLAAFGLAAGAIFLPIFLIRVYGYGYASVGMLIALISGLGMGLGSLGGGLLVDLMARRRVDGLPIVPAVGSLLATIAYLSAFHQSHGVFAVTLLIIGGILGTSHIAAGYAMLYDYVAPDRRATASALYLLLSNLLTMALAPFVAGALMDHIAAGLFAAASPGVPAITVACPGGVPAPGHEQAAVSCAKALSGGTRWALTIVYLSMFWGAGHFWRSSVLLRRGVHRANAGG